jgi:flagellar motor switch protein FliN
MAEDSKGKKKSGKKVGKLALNEIVGSDKKRGVDDQDDDWGDPADIPDLPRSAQDLDEVSDISIRVLAVLGRTSMTVSELTKLGRGAVIELDRKVGEPVDIFLNNRLVARAEVVVVDDKLGINMTEIIKEKRD